MLRHERRERRLGVGAHPDFATTVAAEIKGFDPEEFMTKKWRAASTRSSRTRSSPRRRRCRARSCRSRRGRRWTAPWTRRRAGCLIGSAMGGMHSLQHRHRGAYTQSHRKMNLFCIPFAITNMWLRAHRDGPRVHGPQLLHGAAPARPGTFAYLEQRRPHPQRRGGSHAGGRERRRRLAERHGGLLRQGHVQAQRRATTKASPVGQRPGRVRDGRRAPGATPTTSTR